MYRIYFSNIFFFYFLYSSQFTVHRSQCSQFTYHTDIIHDTVPFLNSTVYSKFYYYFVARPYFFFTPSGRVPPGCLLVAVFVGLVDTFDLVFFVFFLEFWEKFMLRKVDDFLVDTATELDIEAIGGEQGYCSIVASMLVAFVLVV